MEPHDTPVDTPAVSAEHHAWEQQARALKAEGYNGSVAASKLIRQYEVPEDVALALVSSIYGKTVDPRAGETTTPIMSGLVWIGAGLGGALLFYMVVGDIRHSVVIYLALLGVAGKGLRQIIIAMVNSGVKEDLNRS
jgi:hypothetical protein